MTPELRAALKELRRVRAERPGEELGAAAFAAWRVAVAEALEALAPLLLFAEDRQRAVAEARSARAEAAELRASGFDFPDVVVRALEHAGWRPDRSVDISAWDAELAGQGYRLHPVAAAALRSFGGLNLPPVNRAGPNFANDEPLVVDPVAAGSGHHELARELVAELGGEWYPLGEWLSSSSVFVEASGRVVATGLGWIWELGESVGEAVVFALTAHRPLKCLRVVAPGARPWPPT